MPFLRLIRYKNLLIIILTMVLMRYGIIQPILKGYDLALEFPFLYFCGLILAVVLIASAGYLINDYFDVETDTINRPEKVVIGKYIKAEIAYSIYFLLNTLALILSFYISYKIRSVSFFILFPVTIGLLWFYSTTYKRQLLIGNFLVSLITAGVPLLVALYDVPMVYRHNREYIMTYDLNFSVIFIWIGAFAFFASLLNFVRELIKDAEDFEGDILSGRNTLPIVFGMKITKTVIVGVITFIIAGLGAIFYKYLMLVYIPDSSNTLGYITKFDGLSFFYILLFLILPLIAVSFLIIKAQDKKQYIFSATIIKLVMIAGIMFSIVVRFKLS